MKRIECLLLISAVSFFCCSALTAQTRKNVTVKVTNIPSQTGQVLVTTDYGKYYGMAEAAGSETEVTLENIPNGEDTLCVYHDANGNWQLDKNNGIPTEYCATQHIEVTDSTRNISVALVNVKDRVHK